MGAFLPTYFFRRCNTITELQINEKIRDKEIRLISDLGEQLGIMSSRDAQKLADEKKLDLVKISPTAKPPVCKIMDYSKFKYEQSKKEKEARKKQKTVDVKEIRLSPSTNQHDIDIKIKRAIQFLNNGDKVKISMRFRGRELGHTDVALSIFDNIVETVGDIAVIEKRPKMEYKNMSIIMAPKNN